MARIIRLALENFTLTMLILGLVASLIALAAKRGPRTAPVIVEALFAWFLLFSVAVSFFYNFILHVFFGTMTAHFIGWSQSPFQAEVGFANLGFAVVGLIAFRGSFGARAAAVVGPACFLWGAAAGHVMQMRVAHNFAPGNAGVIFYTDIAIPIIGLVLLWLQHRLGRPATAMQAPAHTGVPTAP